MSGQTPGQAAHAGFVGGGGPPTGRHARAWREFSDRTRAKWEAAAQAAIDAFLAGDSVSAGTIREALAAQAQPEP